MLLFGRPSSLDSARETSCFLEKRRIEMCFDEGHLDFYTFSVLIDGAHIFGLRIVSKLAFL